MKTAKEFLDRLNSKGWRVIGRGTECLVMSKGNLVWKIGKVEHKDRPSGAKAWMEACHYKVVKGPWVPKVKKIVNGNDYFAALTEKLEPIQSGQKKSIKRFGLDKNDRSHNSLIRLVERGSLTFCPPDMPDAINSLLSKSMGRGIDLWDENIMKRKNGSWVMTDPWNDSLIQRDRSTYR